MKNIYLFIYSVRVFNLSELLVYFCPVLFYVFMFFFAEGLRLCIPLGGVIWAEYYSTAAGLAVITYIYWDKDFILFT